jgi:ferredoxin
MRLELDADACVGHGRCYAVAPEVFDADDQGHCVLEIAEVPPEHEAAARAGVVNCPEGALTLED